MLRHMESQLLFLGTSGDLSLTAERLRKSGGIIIKSGGQQIHIDPGPGALQESAFQGANPKDTTIIVATHNHIAHSADIPAMIAASTQQGTRQQLSIITSQSVLEHIPRPYILWCQNMFPAVLGKKITVKNIEIHPQQVYHNDDGAVGFKIFTPHSIIGYTGDTKYAKDVAEQYKGTDILIINVKYSRNEKSATNLTMEDAEKMIKIARPTLAILTHFGEKVHSENPLYEAREIQKNTNVQTIVATDGLSIAPESYSAKLKTKTLNLYS